MTTAKKPLRDLDMPLKMEIRSMKRSGVNREEFSRMIKAERDAEIKHFVMTTEEKNEVWRKMVDFFDNCEEELKNHTIRVHAKARECEKFNVDPDNNCVGMWLKEGGKVTDDEGNEYVSTDYSIPIRKYFKPEDMRKIQDELYKMVDSKEPDENAASNRFFDILDSLEIDPEGEQKKGE